MNCLKALINVYLSKNIGEDDSIAADISSEEIVLKALKFLKVLDSDSGKKELDLDKITIFYLCPVEWKSVFIYVLNYFNELDATGNFNQDKVFLQFLRKYLRFAYQWGYLDYFESFLFDTLKETIIFIGDCKDRTAHKLEKMDDGISAKEELMTFCRFLEKCIEIYNLPILAKESRLNVSSVFRERGTVSGDVYRRLFDHIKNIPEGENELLLSVINDLNHEYDNTSLNYREYDNLRKMAKNKLN